MQRLILTLIIALSLLLTMDAASASMDAKLTATQKYNLSYAYAFGKQYERKDASFRDLTNADAPKQNHMGYLFAAIAFAESSAGTNTGRDKKNHHAYGMFQNHIKTVKSKLNQRGYSFNDSQLKKHLEKKEVSAEWAHDELAYWLKVRKGNVRLALASYNAGWNYKAGLTYADKVLRTERKLKETQFLNEW